MTEYIESIIEEVEEREALMACLDALIAAETIRDLNLAR